MRCSFCGHAPERHFIDGGCRACNCPRSLTELVEELAPTVAVASPLYKAGHVIQHAAQPCLLCNATEITVRCAICGATRESK